MLSPQYFISRLKEDDNLALFMLNALGSSTSGDPRKRGFAGFIGSTLIMFAFLSMVWALLDPTTSKTTWQILVVEYLGGLIISLAFGFTLTRKVTISKEIEAALIGLAAGTLMLTMNQAIFTVTNFVPYSATGEGLWLVMLAPIAETLAFNVAIYHWFRNTYPEISWVYIALASDLSFALYHFFRYGSRPDFLIILIVLLIGDTVLMFIYDLTRNATAPMIAHTMVNFATAPAAVLSALETFAYLMLAVFVIVLIIYIIGGKLRK